MKDKKLNDFLPDKNAVFYKKFEQQSSILKISKNEVIEKIKQVFDPEIPVNIYDLGLIYNLEIDDDNNVLVGMTLTTPNCPVADSMPENVGNQISQLQGISSVKVELIWEPKWEKSMMSEDAKLALDIF